MNDKQISIINVREARQKVKTENESYLVITRVKENNASYWNVFHILTILLFNSLSLSPQLLIPHHNSIYYPEYYHEMMMPTAITTSAVVLRYLMDCIIYTDEKRLMTFSVLAKMYLCLMIPILCTFYLSHYLWTSIFGFQHPMPLLGIVIFFGSLLTLMCCIWFSIMFPSELRMNKKFRNKIKRYVIYEIWWVFVNIQRDLLSFGFKSIPGYLQFLFALIVPSVKEINKKILLKNLSKIVEKEADMAFDLLDIRLNIHYAVFIAIRLHGAETSTIVSLIVADFLIQLLKTYQIIKMNKIVTGGNQQTNTLIQLKEKKVMKLLLAEVIEGIVPLAYASGFAMAYFGPNAYSIGNVLCGAWAYEKVENVGRLFIIQFTMFAFDSISVGLNAFLLSKFGNINLMEWFCKTMKAYWIFLAIQLVNTMNPLFALKDINAAMDMTMEFSWITREGRLAFIHNSTDLSDNEKMNLLSNITFS